MTDDALIEAMAKAAESSLRLGGVSPIHLQAMRRALAIAAPVLEAGALERAARVADDAWIEKTHAYSCNCERWKPCETTTPSRPPPARQRKERDPMDDVTWCDHMAKEIESVYRPVQGVSVATGPSVALWMAIQRERARCVAHVDVFLKRLATAHGYVAASESDLTTIRAGIESSATPPSEGP